MPILEDTKELVARATGLGRPQALREWEHSIPPVEALRYSITFRTMASG